MKSTLIWFIVWLAFQIFGLGISLACHRKKQITINFFTQLLSFAIGLLLLWGMGVFDNL